MGALLFARHFEKKVRFFMGNLEDGEVEESTETDNLQTDVDLTGIIDDSELIKAWDDSMLEYRTEWSVAANKHNHKKRLMSPNKTAGKSRKKPNATESEIALHSSQLNSNESAAQHASNTKKDAHAKEATAKQQSENSILHNNENMSRNPPLPPSASTGSLDEITSQMMLHWYYAGYYTALLHHTQTNQKEAKTTEEVPDVKGANKI